MIFGQGISIDYSHSYIFWKSYIGEYLTDKYLPICLIYAEY